MLQCCKSSSKTLSDWLIRLHTRTGQRLCTLATLTGTPERSHCTQPLIKYRCSWHRCVATLCNPGDLIITDEWTYASAVAQAEPYQVRPVAVAMDSEGMCVVALAKLLAEWDEAARGAKR